MGKPNNIDGDVSAAILAGRLTAGVQQVAIDGKHAPVVIAPDGRVTVIEFAAVESYLERPVRKRGSFKFADVDSFIRYFNEHKNGDSRLFADINDTAVSFEGKLDFHGEQPSHCQHTCHVALEPTHEWNLWRENNKKAMGQAAFATFLEENSELFVEPVGSSLLELVETLEGKSHVNISQAVKLQTGAVKLNFTETVELKGGIAGERPGEMQVPTMLKVSIAPFVGTSHYDMQARLRYRIADRKISFWYETVAPHLVVRTIAADMLKVIETKTKLVPFKV